MPRSRITKNEWSFPWTGACELVSILSLALKTILSLTQRLTQPYLLLRYFSKMPCSKPIQRGSWGLEVDKPLFMPPGDPHEAFRATQSPSLDLSRVHLRVDWQTLRRLPLSGAILFNFKALFTPVTEFRDELGVPALVAKVLREGKREIMEYKNTWHVQHVVLPALDQWDGEQVEKGWRREGEEVRTLGESPFFEGWREKWRRQQGF